MNLQPSTSFMYNDRRELFAWELSFGGHGQIPLTGAGTFTPTSSDYVFYKIDFFTASVVGSVGMRTQHSDGQHTGTIYSATPSAFNTFSFPAGYTWTAPITSITLNSGTGIAYQYKKFIPEDLVNT
jgi:hypothetical protein